MTAPRWLLLIHRIPLKPGYLRVKIWRRLQGIGAVPIKNSVYVLPRSEQAYEDLQWISQEIVRSGGDAILCEARFVDGMTDEEVERIFSNARDDDYAALSEDAKKVLASIPETPTADGPEHPALDAHLERLRRRLTTLAAIDFFGAPSRAQVEHLIARIELRLKNPTMPFVSAAPLDLSAYQSRTWVTRSGIHVDRIASAWLILRFIDGTARFRFVLEKTYVHPAEELRFDMFDGEFTHEGELCSFEVLLQKFGLTDRALAAIGEIVHDIDLKESRYARPETPGFERLIAGICAGHTKDEDRLAAGSSVLEAFYEAFKRYEP